MLLVLLVSILTRSCCFVSMPRVNSISSPRRSLQLSCFRTRLFCALQSPQNRDPLFSMACALFSISILLYLFYFLHVAHSLPKTPGVGVGMLSPTDRSAFRPLTPMKSKRFTRILRNHFRMKTFRDTPGGGGIRTFPRPLIRHFAPLNAKLFIPARLFLGGAR